VPFELTAQALTRKTPVTILVPDPDDPEAEKEIKLHIRHKKLTPDIQQELMALRVGTIQSVSTKMMKDILAGKPVKLPKSVLVLHLAHVLLDTDLTREGVPIPPEPDGLSGIPVDILQAMWDEIEETSLPPKKRTSPNSADTTPQEVG
jgi:hypothetical protein